MSTLFKALTHAKGAGSGHNGTAHFIAQRATAIILIPLTLYFLIAILCLVKAENYAAVGAWFANPVNSGLAIAWILTGFYHAALGVQVVIEDYVHCEKLKWLSVIAVRGLSLIFAAIAVVSVVRLALS